MRTTLTRTSIPLTFDANTNKHTVSGVRIQSIAGKIGFNRLYALIADSMHQQQLFCIKDRYLGYKKKKEYSILLPSISRK